MALPFFPQPKPGRRVIDKDAVKREDTRQLAIWRGKVFARDKGTCRRCGRNVVKTISLVPNRAETHHIVSRDDLAVRYDPRNGLLLCYEDHARVTGRVNDKLTIRGSAVFKVNGTPYIDARAPLKFVKVV